MPKLEFKIGKTFIIGEIAQAHDGSLGLAHAYIDAIAAVGADAVKFQTHIAEAESTPAETWRVKFSLQDETRYDYWKRMEFTEEQWIGLKKHCDEKDLLFLSSAFSFEAVDLLSKLGMQAWKIASGETTNSPLLDKIIETKKTILLSTGMSSIDEIDTLVGKIRLNNITFAVLQCTSAYPCPPEKIGLNLIPYFRDRYNCAVGISDHSGTIYPGLAAATLGVEIIEVHVTLSKEMFGPDVPASITTSELKQLVEGVRFNEKMNLYPVDKDVLFKDMGKMRDLFNKSIVAKTNLTAGTVMKEKHLALKKPGTGIPPARLPELLGRRLLVNLNKNDFLSEEVLEGAD
ncbi:MAG: N-acetylneuraminate synthase family protein [Bacteroidetes bacterium]|nr:N-acetylneuraminate synthase family protein [Bacteroidota bacterium]